MLYGALEAGGTKMVVAVINEKGDILERASFPTETPEKTMPILIQWFSDRKPDALGIGTFGPADLDETSPTYGCITSTPKLAWRDYNILGTFKEALNIPIGFDTDVNAAALGEASFGCMQGLSDGIYITIGTGVGVGVLSNGKLLHGMLHPEAGHILLSMNPNDHFEGNCPYHHTCFEGLAAGPALEKRYGKSARELADVPEVWELEAEYIAKALVNYIMILSPKKIVLGGGVMHQEQLFPIIRKKTLEFLNGYINTKEIGSIDQYIVPPTLNDNQGILGCAKLAELAVKR
ncbi:MAG: ROK family protein [Lachnospiraceae bacterium]|nr:ROK family protein [Lachnospiraceae bacterium]